ncbi:carbohydrate-binding module family 13 protein, partial [Hebeloma cylindrosporum]
GREIHPNWNSRWCLAVRARKIVDGTPVEIDRCSGSLGEHWEFKGNPGRTSIRVAGTNLCLDGEIGASFSKNSIVRIRTCSDHIPTQDWYITEDERFALTGTGRCLDRLNGGLSPGTEVQTYGCTDDNTNQVWTS